MVGCQLICQLSAETSFSCLLDLGLYYTTILLGLSCLSLYLTILYILACLPLASLGLSAQPIINCPALVVFLCQTSESSFSLFCFCFWTKNAFLSMPCPLRPLPLRFPQKMFLVLLEKLLAASFILSKCFFALRCIFCLDNFSKLFLTFLRRARRKK